MTVIRINRQKHAALLADHTKDPVTRRLFVPGDEVVVCAKCKIVYLKDVWISSKRSTCCGQSDTASEIPFTEYSTINKSIAKNENKEVRVITRHYPGVAIFLGICSVVTFILFFIWKDKYNNETDKVKSLKSQITGANNRNNSMSADLKNLNTNYSTLYSKYENLRNYVSGFSFLAGMRLTERLNYNYVFGSYDEKVYFTVNSPIFLKTMKVDAKGNGYLKVRIYTVDGTLIAEALNDEIRDGEDLLVFNQNLSTGAYYIIHEGNTDLCYINNFGRYPIESNGLVSITGTSSSDTAYYFYYYDWDYSISMEDWR